MATPLVVRMITAGSVFAPLTALGVGLSSYPFPQGSVFPWITFQVISDAPAYVVNARLATSWTRVQALIFGTGADPANAQAVLSAYQQFLDQTSFDGSSGQSISPNISKGAQELGIAQTQPMTFQIRMDALIRNNETL
jgi:hypothetical protein